jgi:hypothetical protein
VRTRRKGRGIRMGGNGLREREKRSERVGR